MRLSEELKQLITWFVSIHASVKDATFWHNGNRFPKTVSIHASVKDATECLILSAKDTAGFNPRICKRCDNVALFE